MKRRGFIAAAGSAAVLSPVASWAQGAGFTAVDVKNDCRVRVAEDYEAVEEGKVYPFGSTVKTGRNSSLVLQLSPENVFQLLARTKLTISQDVRSAKLKRLNVKLDTGSVSLKLDDFPKDHKLEVETPTAVCGAVGTRFVVTFDDQDGKEKKPESRFSCDKGEVFVSSRFRVGGSEVDGKTFDAPSISAGTAFAATIHEGLENSYSDVTVNRGSVEFDVGGDGKKSSRFVVGAQENKSARFEVSVEKSKSDVDVVAVKVRDGEVVSVEEKGGVFGIGKGKSEETAITPEDGAVVVESQQVKKPEAGDTSIDDYIAAAQVEGEKHTELEQLKRVETPTLAQNQQMKVVEAELKTAAARATKLRQDLIRKRIRTFQRHQRKASGMINRRRIRRR